MLKIDKLLLLQHVTWLNAVLYRPPLDNCLKGSKDIKGANMYRSKLQDYARFLITPHGT